MKESIIEENKLPPCSQEVIMWRKLFLEKHNIQGFAFKSFLSYPSEIFIKKTPSENLIECLAYNQK